MITFEQDEFNLSDYQFLENQFPNDFRVGKKRRYDNKEPPQEMSKQQLQQVTGRISEEVAKKYTIKSPTRKCTFKLTFERDPVYIAGRYCKYSRCLPQSPWSEDKDAPRKPGNSVSEKVCDILKKTFEASDSRFVTSGREDIDVRMLGTGRPFVVELRNCRKTEPVRRFLHYTSENAQLRERLAKAESSVAEANKKLDEAPRPIVNGTVENGDQVQTVIDSVPTRKFSDTEAVHKVTEALENVPQSATVPAQKPRHFHVAPVVDDPKFSQTTTTDSTAVSLKDEPTFQVIQTEESKNMSMDSVKNVIESTQNEPLGNVLETAANVQITVSAELQKKEVVREATGSVGSLEACGIPIACPPTAPHSTPYGTPKDTQRSPTFDEAFAGGVSEGQNQNQNETEKTSMTDSGTISVISQETPPSSSSLTDKVETNGALTASPSAATIPVSVNVEPSLPIDNKIEQAMELVKTHLTYAVREEVDTLRNTIADLEYQMREYQFECNFYRQNCPPETVEQATAFVRQQMTKLQPPARRAVSTTSAPSMEGIQQATANPTSSTHMRNLQTQIQQIKQIVPVAIVPKPSSLTNSSTTPSSTQNDQSDSQ
uniref:tRNA pseudouridine(55) synthase n=1 Tax=Caenorhabditis japonica TaxID=281687 RepID=A0A8R1I1J3_CAEJA